MGNGVGRQEVAEAEHERAYQEYRQAQLERARAEVDADQVRLRITEPRRGENGRLIGRQLAQYSGPHYAAPYAHRVVQMNRHAVAWYDRQAIEGPRGRNA